MICLFTPLSLFNSPLSYFFDISTYSSLSYFIKENWRKSAFWSGEKEVVEDSITQYLRQHNIRALEDLKHWILVEVTPKKGETNHDFNTFLLTRWRASNWWCWMNFSRLGLSNIAPEPTERIFKNKEKNKKDRSNVCSNISISMVVFLRPKKQKTQLFYFSYSDGNNYEPFA